MRDFPDVRILHHVARLVCNLEDLREEFAAFVPSIRSGRHWWLWNAVLEIVCTGALNPLKIGHVLAESGHSQLRPAPVGNPQNLVARDSNVLAVLSDKVEGRVERGKRLPLATGRTLALILALLLGRAVGGPPLAHLADADSHLGVLEELERAYEIVDALRVVLVFALLAELMSQCLGPVEDDGVGDDGV